LSNGSLSLAGGTITGDLSLTGDVSAASVSASGDVAAASVSATGAVTCGSAYVPILKTDMDEVATIGAQVNRFPVYDSGGTLIGFVPVYAA
jgi:hypothetical protein